MNIEDMLNDECFKTDSELQFLIGSYFESIAESKGYYEDEYINKALCWYKKAIENGHGQAEIALKSLQQADYTTSSYDTNFITNNKYITHYDFSKAIKHVSIKNEHNEVFLLIFISDLSVSGQDLEDLIKNYQNQNPFVICCADHNFFNLKENLFKNLKNIDLITIGSFSESFMSLVSTCSFGDSGILPLSLNDYKTIKNISPFIQVFKISGNSYLEISNKISKENDITSDKNKKIVMNFDSNENTSLIELSKVYNSISAESNSLIIGYKLDSPYTEKTIIIIKPFL